MFEAVTVYFVFRIIVRGIFIAHLPVPRGTKYTRQAGFFLFTYVFFSDLILLFLFYFENRFTQHVYIYWGATAA